MKRAIVFMCWLCFPIQAASQFISPGDLSNDHIKLNGQLECGKCHASGKKLSTSQCLNCHQELGARISAGKGLHGAKYRGKDCGLCHVEHLGRKATLVKWPGGKKESFNHADTQWPLLGKHASVSCTNCHARKNSMGRPMFLGAKTACIDCHKDPHDNRFGADCASCHNEKKWNDTRIEKFDHNRTRYPLKGAHAAVKCAQCHQGSPPKYKPLEFQKCTDCHKDPHEGKLQGACTSCHNEKSWKDVLDSVRSRHPGVSLANGHRTVKCQTEDATSHCSQRVHVRVEENILK